jgi:recombination protein RecA
MSNIISITVGDVQALLQEGKSIKVKTLNDEFTKITNFINKGILNTYRVILQNKKSIKVSNTHKFFTNVGWLETKNLIPKKSSILCDDGKYSIVESVDLIGKYKIVDIAVEHPDRCYFGNGMLNHNTGKSLFCAQLIAETQKKNGLSVFFDSEFSVDKTFWTALGINVKNVNYVPFTTLEELFTKMELCIGTFRKADDNRLLTIFVDSVAQASIESEMESEHGVTGYNTGKSLIIGKALRKITGLISKQRVLVVFTNQVRYNMNAGPFGEKWIVPGGKALPHASSVRIRFANLGKIKEPTTKEVIGMECQAQVIKNRCGPNFRSASFEIHYDSGVQDLASWLDCMKKFGIVTGDGRGYKYKRTNGDVVEFNAYKFIELMNTDPILKEEIYQAICAKYIMQYRTPNTQILENVEKTGNENDDITNKAVKEE